MSPLEKGRLDWQALWCPEAVAGDGATGPPLVFSSALAGKGLQVWAPPGGSGAQNLQRVGATLGPGEGHLQRLPSPKSEIKLPVETLSFPATETAPGTVKDKCLPAAFRAQTQKPRK